MSELVHFDEDDQFCQGAPPFPYPTNEELISLLFTSYLEAERSFDQKIVEWRWLLREARELIKADLRDIAELSDERSRWFAAEVLKALTPAAKSMREALGHIARLQMLKATARRVFNVKSPAGANSDFDEKLNRARQMPILDVVSQVLEVKKRGKNYVAVCPFHNDKNPSLHIYPKTDSFHCFGCHKGGDAISFVRLHFGYGFRQAVAYLLGGIEDERTGIRKRIRGREGRGQTGGQDPKKKEIKEGAVPSHLD